MSSHHYFELPYDSGMFQTLSRLLFGKWSSIGSRHPWWSMCIPTKELCCYRKCQCLIPFASMILAISMDWSLVSPYLVQPRYRYCYSTRFRHIPSPWPSHMLQHWMNLTKWAQSIFHHSDEQILLLVHTPLPTPLATQDTPFQSPSYVMMVDAIKVASRCSDYHSDLSV
jgi:hypothetical protein